MVVAPAGDQFNAKGRLRRTRGDEKPDSRVISYRKITPAPAERAGVFQVRRWVDYQRERAIRSVAAWGRGRNVFGEAAGES